MLQPRKNRETRIDFGGWGGLDPGLGDGLRGDGPAMEILGISA
jgi:hypothetical protein